MASGLCGYNRRHLTSTKCLCLLPALGKYIIRQMMEGANFLTENPLRNCDRLCVTEAKTTGPFKSESLCFRTSLKLNVFFFFFFHIFRFTFSFNFFFYFWGRREILHIVHIFAYAYFFSSNLRYFPFSTR